MNRTQIGAHILMLCLISLQLAVFPSHAEIQATAAPTTAAAAEIVLNFAKAPVAKPSPSWTDGSV